MYATYIVKSKRYNINIGWAKEENGGGMGGLSDAQNHDFGGLDQRGDRLSLV